MTDLSAKDRLFALLDREFSLTLNGIDPDRSIFEQIPVDSMALIAIAARIEQEFGIELPLNFMEQPTLSHIVKLIARGSAACA